MQNGFTQALRFEDATFHAGVATPADPNGYGHGVAVADYNGDGLSDIYIVSYDADNALFINNGDGSFTDRAQEAGVRTGSRYDRGIAAADYDNDGDVDFFIASGAGSNKLLYANEGEGSFFNFADESGLRLANFQGQGVSWGDYDNDGDLDLFLPSYDNASVLFRQEADHTFTEVTESAGIIYSDYAVQSVFFDFDLDGDLDIFVSRGEGFPNRLFVNQGNGTFRDEAVGGNVADPDPHGQGLAVADYDADGDLDVYMSNSNGRNRLYRNDGARFEEVGAAAGVDDNSRSLGCLFADFDNDGWPDLYVGNFGRNRIYRNNGDGTFTDETESSGADDANRAYGTSVLDYDVDGRVDIFFSNSGQPSNLLHNLGPKQHWLKISLRGKHSNRNGIGSRVAFTSGGRRQLQQLIAGSSMVSGGSDLMLHFGLGVHTQAEKIEVYWPSGERDVLQNVAADQAINIIEGSYGIPPSDTTAPQFSGIIVETNSNGIVTINWSTDEPATAQIEYGLTTSYGSLTPLITTPSLYHIVRITELRGEEFYHFRVRANDAAGNLAVSEDETFLTPPLLLPPIIKSVHMQNVTGHSAEISWRTHKSTNCVVAYGATTSYGLYRLASTPDGLQHHVKLEGLASSTAYHFRISARYNKNQLVHSRDHTFTTLFEADTTRPVISNVAARGLTHNSVIIAWDTDEASTSQVEYGLTSNYGNASALDSAPRTHHEIKLENLAANTLHHFRVLSRDAAGNLATSNDAIFETQPEPDTQPPLLSNIAAREIGVHSAKIVWDTDEAATSQVEYGASTNYGQTVNNNDLQIHHEIVLENLAANTLYHFRVQSRDVAGNAAISNDFVVQTSAEIDNTPPQISNIDVHSVTTNRATIVWDTDENANSRVEYGFDTNYGEVAQDNALSTHHEIELTQLSSNTTYHFRVLSSDAAGNRAGSDDFTFTTERSGGGSGTITDDFNRSDIGSDWTLDDRYWEIRDGELGHTSEATGSWRYLAVFNRISNGDGLRITEVSYRWGQNVDDIGVREGAMALMIDGNSAHASGYWIWHRYNQVWLWTIVNGEYVGGIDLGHWSGRSDPVAGDVVTVVIREEADANYFDYYINGGYSATAVDPAKHFPRSDNWYAGVFMRGEDVHNECDDFSVTYVQGSAQTPVLSDIHAAEIGSAAAMISWSTNIPAQTKIEYRLAESSRGLAITNVAMATSHAVALSDLSPNRSYRYRIVARSAEGISAASVEHQFVTKPDNGDLANNVELLGFLPMRGEPTLGNVWGYADTSGEYALVCLRQNGLAVVDVTDPRQPKRVAGASSFYNDLKEVKIYDHYAVAVNEFGPMQIIDLANPRQPELIALYEDSFSGGHNLFIEGHYAYVVGTHPVNSQQDDPTGLHIIDLSDPLQPRLAGKREGFYIHDLYVENDTAYVLGYRTSRVHLWDVSDKQNIRELAAFQYHYPHSVRRGLNKNILLLDDEGRGQDVQFWDIGDLNNIRAVGSYMTDPMTAPHNIETIGNLAYIAYFEDMLRIVDYSNPSSPVEAGVYDTYPENPSNGQPPGAHQTAAWGVYPHAPSGNIYLSDMTKGLYVFRYVPPGPVKNGQFASGSSKPAAVAEIIFEKKNALRTNAETPVLPQQFALSNYPNPFYAAAGTRMRLQMPAAAEIDLEVFDILGKTVKQITAGSYAAGTHEIQWRGDNQEGRSVAPGIYLVRLRYRRAGEQPWAQLRQRILILH